MRGGGETVMLLEVSESHMWGTIAVPSVASKRHCPGKDRKHPNIKASFLCKETCFMTVVNEGNFLPVLYLSVNILEFGRECF